MHNLIELPQGKRVEDLLPQFAGVVRKIGPFGPQCQNCPGCGKPFTILRKPRKKINLYSIKCPFPLAIEYRLCGRCTKQYLAGGDQKDAVLTAIERFVEGAEVTT